MVKTKTLEECFEEGKLPVPESLRMAMSLAESLRRLHDTGRVHGAITPARLHLTAAGLELMPADGAPQATPYTAPEVAQGSAPDARSDIFSFGAILFEMLTGRRAFDASTVPLDAAPASGSAAVDRVVGPCISKNPASRPPRMQKVMMELKLLMVAARRAEASAAARRQAMDSHALRTEMREMEARLETQLALRMESHQRSLAELKGSLSDAGTALKVQLAAVRTEVMLARQQAASLVTVSAEQQLDAVASCIMERVDRSFRCMGENISAVQNTLDALKQHTHQFEQSVAADMADVEQSLNMQSAAIESARTAMSQTDDLVERVVEALESLQTAVLDPTETPIERVIFAVN
jgi:hypothetical protein